MGKLNCFQLAFESDNRVNAKKCRRQLGARPRSGHSELAVAEWWRGTWPKSD